MSNRILVVDDELEIRRLVSSYLVDAGYVVEELEDGQAAVERFGRSPDIDLAILDVRMPRRNGIDALREIRRQSDCYVIMLTAATEETDRIVGLSVGADDYVTKPFSPRELVARVEAVLRRRRDHGAADVVAPPARAVVELGSTVIDVDERRVFVAGDEIPLTALQFDLLLTMARSPGRVFARHQLIERVWGRDFFGEERIVDVHVANLRKALRDAGGDPSLVGTVRGVGYRVERPDDPGASER